MRHTACHEALVDIGQRQRTTQQVEVEVLATVTMKMWCDTVQPRRNSTTFRRNVKKDKVKLSLCLIKYCAMKTYGGVEI
jgi:hypothetical protein